MTKLTLVFLWAFPASGKLLLLKRLEQLSEITDVLAIVTFCVLILQKKWYIDLMLM